MDLLITLVDQLSEALKQALLIALTIISILTLGVGWVVVHFARKKAGSNGQTAGQ